MIIDAGHIYAGSQEFKIDCGFVALGGSCENVSPVKVEYFDIQVCSVANKDVEGAESFGGEDKSVVI